MKHKTVVRVVASLGAIAIFASALLPMLSAF
jgi:hypothetical protein